MPRKLLTDKQRRINKQKLNYAWAKKHPKERNEQRKRCGIRAKVEVLTHYGKDGRLQCCWSGCQETDIDVLTLDHVNNDGWEYRKRGGTRGRGIYHLVRHANYPDGFQTLCMNHQFKKEILRKRALVGNG